jgi:hypothetical protein
MERITADVEAFHLGIFGRRRRDQMTQRRSKIRATATLAKSAEGGR